MERKFLVRVFLAVALSTAPAFSAGPAPVGVVAQKNGPAAPMLIRPVEAQTKIALQSTGAASTPKRGHSDRKTLYWVIGITAGAALAIGLTAAAQHKSPF